MSTTTITCETGDMFKIAERDSLSGWALAHCISEDCAMGKGIATEFKSRFGGVADLKAQIAGGKKSGSAAVLRRDGRLVFYLITKRVYHAKPTYATIEGAIEDMASQMVETGVEGCIMPRIGCGLDRLQWEKVHEIIERIFADKGLSALVCTL